MLTVAPAVTLVVTAGAAANTTEGNRRASRESGLVCSVCVCDLFLFDIHTAHNLTPFTLYIISTQATELRAIIDAGAAAATRDGHGWLSVAVSVCAGAPDQALCLGTQEAAGQAAGRLEVVRKV